MKVREMSDSTPILTYFSYLTGVFSANTYDDTIWFACCLRAFCLFITSWMR